MNEINEIVDHTTEINEKLSRTELIERYAKIQQISIEEAEEQVGAPTEEEILKKIEQKTIEKINSTRVSMNRAQRRALKKKVGAKKYAEMVAESGDVDTEETAMQMIEDVKDKQIEGGYTVTKSGYTAKFKKSKGEIVDTEYKVTIEKTFN